METLTRQAALAAIFLLFSSACTSAAPGPSGEEGEAEAESESEAEAESESESEGQEGCDDHVACTADRYRAGKCEHLPLHALCDSPLICDPEQGCVEAPPCADASDCEELGVCSIARCDRATATCQYDNVDDDGDGYVAQGCGGNDCDDSSESVNPNPDWCSAPGSMFGGMCEICNGRDDNCDGQVDNIPMLGCQGCDCSTNTCGQEGVWTCFAVDGGTASTEGCRRADGVALRESC